MTQFLLQLALYFTVGFIETFIYTQKTYWIAQNRSKAASILVFFESIIYLFIFFRLLNDLPGNYFILIAYALGNSIGTYINLEKVPF